VNTMMKTAALQRTFAVLSLTLVGISTGLIAQTEASETPQSVGAITDDATEDTLVPTSLSARDLINNELRTLQSEDEGTWQTDRAAVTSSDEALMAQTPAEPTQVAQIVPGRRTRSGPSYIGVAGNIGLTGETAMSRGNFAVISKIGLTPNFSVRPGAIIGDDTVFLLPVTADFPIRRAPGGADFGLAPYVGGGLAISTGDDSEVGGLITGGIDVPVATRLTANGSVNVGFLEDTEVSIILGLGYTF
jgi:hypothetical protein